MINKKFYNLNYTLFFLICIVTLLLRVYQVNFEDYWFDEHASFWVADPSLTLNETIKRSYNLDQGTHLFFGIILKFFFNIFGYTPGIGRYLPLAFGILSIPAISYLAFQLRKGQSYLYVAFLCSINFYLVSYSQELRSYSLIFLLSILSIIFYYKILDHQIISKKKILFLVLYIFFTLLGTCLHIFFFIIVISQICFLFLKFFHEKKIILFNLFSILSIFFLYFSLMHETLLMQLKIDDFWIKQIELNFFINYYFSRFFGSKIMGIIYLFILVLLIFLNIKKIKYYDKNNFLLILVFFSYFLPITYSFIQKPILTDRYIIFVLVPIFILISNLTFDLKNNKVKFCIFFLIIVSSITNNYIEIFKRQITKPQFNASFEEVSNSNIKKIIIKSPVSIENIIINYAKNTKVAKRENIIFYGIKDIYLIDDSFWLTCYEPINSFDCSIKNYSDNSWTKIDQVDYKLISSSLYSK